MSNVEKISVALTHDMVNMVKSSVSSGEYGSASEVIRDALREWASKRERQQAEITYLRTAWEAGINSGPGQFSSIDDLLAHASREHKCQN